ncbi:MAG: type II toxin-antitoxin system RelE/ParE family toxin [Bryobacteraceae bacterium]
MKVTYREAARDDVTRQYRYYLVLGLPEVAARFREAVRKTAKAIGEQPRAAPTCRLRNAELRNLRSWPVAGFESIRFYFLVDDEAIRVIRILHGKRDVRRILEQEDLH